MSDPLLLHRILDDSELAKALLAFFQDQAEGEKRISSDMMALDHPDSDLARKHACYSTAYEEAMNRLRAYVRQV